MSGTVLATLLALVSAVMHAGWNAAVKSGEDRMSSIAMIDFTAVVVCGAAMPFVGPPDAAAWGFIAVSATLNTVYRVCLIRAYQLGDFGQMYPVMRGSAPALAAVGSTVVLGQQFALIGWGGVALVSLGIASLVFVGGNGRAAVPLPGGEIGGAVKRSGRPPSAIAAAPFLFALGAGFCIACYTVTDAGGVRTAGHVLNYSVYAIFAESLFMPVAATAIRRRAVLGYAKRHWRTGLFGGLDCLLAYCLVLWALSLAPAAQVEALRETSVLLAAGIGTVVFHEPFGRGRAMCAAAVAAGIVLIH